MQSVIRSIVAKAYTKYRTYEKGAFRFLKRWKLSSLRGSSVSVGVERPAMRAVSGGKGVTDALHARSGIDSRSGIDIVRARCGVFHPRGLS